MRAQHGNWSTQNQLIPWKHGVACSNKLWTARCKAETQFWVTPVICLECTKVGVSHHALPNTPPLRPIKPALHGQYEPPLEAIAVSSRRQVTQLRRIISFKLCIAKHRNQMRSHVRLQLTQEWNQITRDTSFGVTFSLWSQNLQALPYPEWPFPSDEWLHDLVQLVKFHVDAQVKQDHIVLQQKLEYRRRLDKKDSTRQAFAKARGPGKPPVTSL